MRLLLIAFLACIFFLPVLSCEKTSPEEENAAEPVTDTAPDTLETNSETEDTSLETEPSSSRTVNLEMCYATSIHFPEIEFGPENVFDGNMETCWVTMPGAGQNEGIFFSFEDVQFIHSIDVYTLPADEEYEEVRYIVPYINGMEAGLHRNDGDPIIIDAEVKTVFLKIQYLSGGNGGTEENPMHITYTGNLPVGVCEVTFSVPDENDDYTALELVPIRSVSGTIEASSALEPVEAYNTDFLFDSRTGFGWADGNTDATGDGEYLSFAFDSPQRIEKVRFWNGYQRSDTHFTQNERAASAAMGSSGGDMTVYDLEDSRAPQTVTLETPFEGSEFRIDFTEIYQGDTYRDLVISELRFFNGEEWFILDSGGSEARKLEILAWADTTAAGIFMDRNLYAQQWDNYWDDDLVQNLVIRSNGSFVLWKSLYGDNTQEKTYADGNWQVLDSNSIRIFGKIHYLGDYDVAGYDLYSGVQTESRPDLDRTSIFSDTLLFDEHHLESCRGLLFQDFLF